MTSARPGDPSDLGAPEEQTPDGRGTADRVGSIQRLYDMALERTAVDRSPASQRYLSVLLAAS